MKERLRAIRDRADLVALGALALTVALLPSAVPGGVYGLGIVSGSALALHAAGIVLVYRTNRIVNFAQVQVGVLAAFVFRLLVEQRIVLRAFRAICEPCIDRETGGALAASWWISLALSFAGALVLSWLIHAFVVRRFADAPRLVLTVATIGVAQLLASAQTALPGLLATQQQRDTSALPQGVSATPPFDLSFRWSPAVFRAGDLLTVAVAAAAVAALIVFLRRSRLGVTMRAAAENPQRAATLGIDVDGTTGGAWVLAGALSAAAGLLVAMSSPAVPVDALNVGLTIRILAAAVVASMTSIPIAVAASLALSIVDQSVLWLAGSGAIADGVLAGAIAAVLLLRRDRVSRVEEELAGAWRAAREVRPIPRELRGLPEVRRWVRTGVGALAAAALALPVVLSGRQTAILTTTLVYAMVGTSLLVLSGWAGQISLGQFALAGIGAYAAAMAGARAGFPMPAAVVAGGVAGAAAAAAVGVPALRLRGLNLAITTLGVALVTSSILLSPSSLGRHLPESLDRPALLGIDLEDGRTFYYIVLAALALVLGATLGLRRSRFGRVLIAGRDNALAAQSFGADLVRARLAAFVVSGSVAGVAGAILAYQQHGLRPASFTPDVSVTIFLMTVIGGLGSVAGPLVGALFLGALALASVSPLVLFLATGGGVVFLLLVAPGGLAQLGFDLRDTALRRVARGRGIVVPSLVADLRVDPSGRPRAPVAPKLGPAGSTAFVPARYRLGDQWGIEPKESRRA